MRRVLKWAVPIDDEPHLIGSGLVVHVGQQQGDNRILQVWTQETDGVDECQRAVVFGTGHPISDDALRHAGSVVVEPFVWHVYVSAAS